MKIYCGMTDFVVLAFTPPSLEIYYLKRTYFGFILLLFGLQLSFGESMRLQAFYILQTVKDLITFESGCCIIFKFSEDFRKNNTFRKKTKLSVLL